MQTEEPCDSLARCCVSLVLLCLFVSSSLLFFAISFLQLVFALDWFSSSLRAPLSSHCQCPNVSFSFPPLCVYSESLLISPLWLSDSPWPYPTFSCPLKLSFLVVPYLWERQTRPKENYSYIYLFLHYVYVCVLVQVCGSLCLMPVFGVIAIRA